MSIPEFLWINGQFAIPTSELEFRFAQSGGPGGQHVNKTSTKVLLRFDVLTSPSLEDKVRTKLLGRLANRLDKQGVLQIIAQSTRSQLKNKSEAVDRLCLVLEEALKEQKPRKATRPSRASKERRLNQKKQNSQKKKERGQKWH